LISFDRVGRDVVVADQGLQSGAADLVVLATIGADHPEGSLRIDSARSCLLTPPARRRSYQGVLGLVGCVR
jgi:hypothetical protein